VGRRLRAALLPLLVAAACPVQAQQIEPFEVGNISGFVDLGFRARREDRSRNGVGTAADSDEIRFEERLHLNLGGYVYHPRFLRYRASADLRVLQELLENDSDVLIGGSWTLNFLQEHPYNFAIFGDVHESQVERPFFRTFDQRSALYGSTLRIGAGPVPVELTYTHSESQRFGAVSDLDQKTDQLSARSRYRVGEWSEGDLEYRATSEDVREQEISRHRLFASNRTFFDRERRKEFTGNLHVRQQEDDAGERLTTSAYGNLGWQHSSKFSTQYRLGFEHSDTELQTVNNWDLGTSLEHQLYESLTSTLELHGRLQDATFGTIERYGLTLGEDYTKQVGAWGRLDIDLASYTELTRYRPAQTTAAAVDESLVLPAIDPVELAQPNVDPTTIVVTDEAGSIVYLEGVDYLVTVGGYVTELTRLATGTIAPDERVLVDYAYRLTGPSDLLSQGLNLDLGLTIWERMLLYTKFRFSEEQRLGGDPGRELRSRDRELIGLRMSRGWISTRTELERDHSSDRSFLGVRQTVSVSLPKRSWWYASFSGTNRFQSFDRLDQRVVRLTSIARFGADVGRRGLLSLAMEYQWENWSGSGDSGTQDLDGFGVKAAFTWRFRRVEATVEGSLARIDRYGQQENTERFFLRLRRRF
jgi:hypothetical protein